MLSIGTQQNRFGSYENKKDFAFICINNNDNELIISPSPTPTPPNPPPPPCEVTVDTITGLGNSPWGITYDPVNQRMYVANFFDATVSVIDTNTNDVTDTITVGEGPEGIAYDPLNRVMYVINTGDNTVSVIDTTTNPPSVICNPIEVGEFPAAIALTL